MRRLGAVGIVVVFAVTSGAVLQKPPTVRLLSVDAISRQYSRGVARIRGGWVLSGPAVITRTDKRFHELKINRHPIPQRLLRQGYSSIGDVTVANTFVYAPLERSDGRGREMIARYNVDTLRFLDVVQLRQHVSSFVAIDPLRLIAYTMDRQKANTLLRFDIVRSWKSLPPLTLTKAIVHGDAGAVGGGKIWITSSGQKPDIYRIDERTGRVDDIIATGDNGAEGLDATRLYQANIHVTTIDRHGRVTVDHFEIT